ncbi:UDP-N-acetylglucosamine 2-epimerase, partial [Dehalococcoidia bacterium]|nr:UDP-N-acetylglucosamine 2-epimerase [Dehalococcoidia bacterium]
MAKILKGYRNMKRKIAVVTGARAEYGYLKPLMEKIEDHTELELSLYVTGMHLLKEYGNAIQEIERDGFKIAKTIDMDVKVNNTNFDMALSIGKGITGFANAFKEDNPDIVVVFADRIEPFAAATAATLMNIPVAHIEGGDVGLGDIDDNLRHAITKLAHLHFTSSNQSKERVLRLGEEEWRVFQVGALSLDTILNEKVLSKDNLCKKYNIPDKPLILISYHPVTTEWREAERQMKLVVESAVAVANEEDKEVVIIYPNAYPGGFQIIHAIKSSMQKSKNIHVFENLPHLDYISLMAISSVFVGNSSSGIMESPSIGNPYVCIGTRQQGRERAKNVIDVGYRKDEIISGIKRALFDKEFLDAVKKCESPYG